MLRYTSSYSAVFGWSFRQPDRRQRLGSREIIRSRRRKHPALGQPVGGAQRPEPGLIFLPAQINAQDSFRIDTVFFFKFFRGGIFNDWEALFASLSKLVLDLNESIQKLVAVNCCGRCWGKDNRNPKRFVTFRIESGSA